MKKKDKKVHLGQKIQELVEKKRLSKADFARMINKTRPSVYHIYASASVDSELLATISLALEYNFFQLYTNNFPPLLLEGNTSAEVARLKKELEMRDKLIALLEEKKKK